jgi:UDP-2-acetamido-2,6-beta-L-arabino-hexul-4-ose reductase
MNDVPGLDGAEIQSASEAAADTASRVQIARIAGHQDARGSLFEPLDASELAEQRNIHVVITAPDAIRGNHFHRHSVEITAVVGPCLVRLKEGDRLREVTIPAGEAWRLTIPPGVVHAYRNIGSAAMVLVSFNSSTHDPGNPDTLREVIL